MTTDMQGLDLAMHEAKVTQEAIYRYSEMESYHNTLLRRYERCLMLYDPPGGDQWPEDIIQRPGKIHITANIIRPSVDVDARIQSMLPRLTIQPDNDTPEERKRAELAEKYLLACLEASGWESWLYVLNQSRAVYGKGVLKVFWNDEDKRPDVTVVENPANLRVGWGASDYSTMDWALYEYELSPEEAMRRFPEIRVELVNRHDGRVHVHRDLPDTETPPAVSLTPNGISISEQIRRPLTHQLSDYEQRHVKVWDYWYKDEKGVVCNAFFVERVLAQKIEHHPYMPTLPYIVVQFDHKLGSPEGNSIPEMLEDLQLEYNRVLSHAAQLVQDEIDPAWQLKGENSMGLIENMVPRAGEIIPVGDGEILPIPRGTNLFPAFDLMREIQQRVTYISGQPPILFGDASGVGDSGRARAIQVESAANRLEPRRTTLYTRGLGNLVVFWIVMIENIRTKTDIAQTEDGKVVSAPVASELVQGLRRVRFIPPEITPRDSFEHTQNEINKVNAKLSSVRTSMDQIGIESPEAEIALIEQERSSAKLFPSDVQAQVALLSMMQTLQINQQQLMQMQQGQADQLQQLMGGEGNAEQQAQAAQAGMQQEQFAAQPSGFEDQNQAQPMTQPGMPPPAGGQGPNVNTTTLVRGDETLNQIAFTGEVM